MSGRSKKAPLKRHFISLESKIQILNRLKKGEKVSQVAKSLSLNEATIRTIKKNEQKIRTAVTAGSPISANMTARPRAPIIEKMEKTLSIWIHGSIKKHIPLDGNVIKQKALQIYNHLRESGEFSVNPDFVASKGWFERFKKRFSLHNIKIQGERFYDMTTEAVQELLVEEKTGEADLVEMAFEVNQITSEDDSTDENIEVQNFTLETIREGMNIAEQLQSYFLNTDPSTERSTKFKRELQKCLAPYYEIYEELSIKSKQTKISNVLKKAEDTRSLDTVEKSSECKDTLQQRKHTHLIVLSSDEEKEN